MSPIDGVALSVSLILLVALVHRRLGARAHREPRRDWFCWDCGAHVVATVEGWRTHRSLCSRRLIS